MSCPSLNIILFGETGTGKSSLINLIAGKHVAETPQYQGSGCTMSFKPYEFKRYGHELIIWDTVGLEEPETGTTGYLPAIEQAYELIHNMVRKGGVDLLLFCIRGNRQVTSTTQSNYRLFYEVLCRSKDPIAAVITHLERETNMEDWWSRNVGTLEKYGMKFAGHACVTGLSGHFKSEESRRNVEELLAEGSNAGRFTMPPEKWTAGLLRPLGLSDSVPLPEEATRRDISKYLMKRCGLDQKVAEVLADSLEGRPYLPPRGPNKMDKREDIPNLTEHVIQMTRNVISGNTSQYTVEERNITRTVSVESITEGRSSPPPQLPTISCPSLNIVLFGETGVGKSSLINLIAGKHIAEISPDVMGCTMSFKPYDFKRHGRELIIWDTVGLEEPEKGTIGYLPAIEQACELIHNMVRKGGVDLLLFCIRGNRATATMQSNYRLFYEVLCRSKAPIVAVVTHLEKEINMENWWSRNVESLEKYGMKFAGHACVTGLSTHPKYKESQLRMDELLMENNNTGRFTMPPEKWFIEFLRYFGLFVPLPEEAKRKDIIRSLTKRCKMDPETAEKLADTLESRPDSLGSRRRETATELTSEQGIETPGRNKSQRRDAVEEGGIHYAVAVKFVIGLNKHKKYIVNLKRRATLIDRTIVPLLGVVDKPMPGIVTRWYPNGSLSNYLCQRTSLSFEEKKAMLGDVAIGLRYLHNQQVVHGNLHSNNILIGTDGICCLTDLAFTLPDKFIGASWLGNFNYESLRFADPKLVMWAQNAPDQVISPNKYCDVYSFGGVILHVMYGTKPYGDLGRLDILEKLLLAERPEIPSRPTQIPPGYEALIRDCWDDDDEQRPSAMSFITQNWFKYR